MNRISVYCGSSPGLKKEYTQAAEKLGHYFVKKNICLVYGGGSVGIMGKIARAVLEQGGEVIGVIPEAMVKKDLALKTVPDMRIVNSMHERKALIENISDGFIALPGGLGTIEEIFEMLTWAQLSLHHKPCGILNVAGYFDRLISFLDIMMEQHFVQQEVRSMIIIEKDPEVLLQKFEKYQPPSNDKSQWALRLSRKKPV